jgi:hypothetical protein
VYRFLLLIPILLFGCQQTARQKAPDPAHSDNPATETKPIPFKLISGNTNSDSAAFEAEGITATIVNSQAGMQTIHITQHGKRLINYIRAVDSSNTALPAPELFITGTDTAVGFNLQQPSARKFFFRIKNNKAIYTKIADTPAAADSIKKAPADAGAF